LPKPEPNVEKFQQSSAVVAATGPLVELAIARKTADALHAAL